MNPIIQGCFWFLDPKIVVFFCFSVWGASAQNLQKQLFFKSCRFRHFLALESFWASCLSPWGPRGVHFGTILSAQIRFFRLQRQTSENALFFVIFSLFFCISDNHFGGNCNVIISFFEKLVKVNSCKNH